jgi:hypothetical protein
METMKVGELFWNDDLVMFYPDINSAIWDSQSVPVDDLDGPLRCNQLSRFLKKKVTYLKKSTSLMILDTFSSVEDPRCDAVEVLAGNKKGWLIKRDFKFLHLYSF